MACIPGLVFFKNAIVFELMHFNEIIKKCHIKINGNMQFAEP